VPSHPVKWDESTPTIDVKTFPSIANSNEEVYDLSILARILKVHLMADRWQLQEAKNRLSEVVRKAREDAPQIITVHGTDAVVVMAADQYRKLAKRKGTLVDFFQRSPLAGLDLDLDRSSDAGRDIDI